MQANVPTELGHSRAWRGGHSLCLAGRSGQLSYRDKFFHTHVCDCAHIIEKMQKSKGLGEFRKSRTRPIFVVAALNIFFLVIQ